MSPTLLRSASRRTWRLAASALLLVASAACSDSPTGPPRPADPCEALPLPPGRTVTGSFGPDSCLAQERRVAVYAVELSETSTLRLTVSGIECLCVRAADGALIYETTASTESATTQHLVLPAGRYHVRLRARSDTARGEYRLTTSVWRTAPAGCVDGGVGTARGATVSGAITEDDCGPFDDLNDRFGVWLEAGQTIRAAARASDEVGLELHGQDERLASERGSDVSVRHTATESDYYTIEVAGASGTSYTLSVD